FLIYSFLLSLLTFFVGIMEFFTAVTNSSCANTSSYKSKCCYYWKWHNYLIFLLISFNWLVSSVRVRVYFSISCFQRIRADLVSLILLSINCIFCWLFILSYFISDTMSLMFSKPSSIAVV